MLLGSTARRTATALAAVAGCALAALTPLAAPASAAGSCYDPAAPITVEEARLDDALPGGGGPVGPRLVAGSPLAATVHAFVTGLCAQTPATAAEYATISGQHLWHTAVATAQRGDYDDRPLYWARLTETKAIHQWRAATPTQRVAVFTALDRAARGLRDVRFPPGTKHLMVSGFDPFELDGGNLRRGNPAGAAALQLDGRVFRTAQGLVAVQAVSFPVLWGAFDDGIVEAAYGPAMRRDQLSGIVTISQGFPGKFTIERWAGDWRGGFPDNNNISSTGAVPPAPGWPQPADQFIETTLPYQQMIAAARGTYPVEYHLPFCQWAPGSTPGTGTPQCFDSGSPTPGAIAEEGGGGNYLSNESMYRANRLRLGLGLGTLHGGHLHTPVLGQPAGTALTDPAFEAERKSIVDETVSMIPAVNP